MSTPKSVSGYRTIPVGTTLINILKRAKMQQKENKLKYGEFYQQDQNHDFVCKKRMVNIILRMLLSIRRGN